MISECYKNLWLSRSPWGVVRPSKVDRCQCGARLFIPMRGCEGHTRLSPTDSDMVIYPHEGLWAYPRFLSPLLPNRYLSPWGVVRWRWFDAGTIAGKVIYPHEGLWGGKYDVCEKAVPGYLSPWGVVRKRKANGKGDRTELFIPMRGCEPMILE